MPLERTIVSAILIRLRKAGAFAEKNHGNEFTRQGTPDIYACLQGRFIAIEVKQPGKKPTPAQVQVLTEIEAAGGITRVMTSASEVDVMLREEFGRG